MDGVSESVARAVVFALDPTPAQERLLNSYCGAARFAFNWARGVVIANLATRAAMREAGVCEEDLTPSLSWWAYSLRKQFNAVKDEWLNPSRHGVRLMLPQSTPDRDVSRRREQLVWIHTVESTRRLFNLVDAVRASIQKVTYSFRGGRWQVSFLVRHWAGGAMFVARSALLITAASSLSTPG